MRHWVPYWCVLVGSVYPPKSSLVNRGK
ncbi:hypothetical protein F383_18891 [Gossypium arboreum]|uniref:Uncharacterized protein n=1 Tax=Gossypium arboreum TaxID=29729 RepID=A0A0B0NH08_GOSAR|nr:hypothetical protein F383_18891 [Gossypium arboreum]